MERRILHLQVPAFRVAVQQVREPGLRGRPVAVLSRRSSRAVVTAVSPEARAAGVRAGMCLAEARARCRDLRLAEGNSDLQRRASAAMSRLAAACSPLVEPAPEGRLFADLSGTGRLLGASRDLAARLQREVAMGLGLPCRVGLSSNKLVSRVASRVVPVREMADVPGGDEARFLSPLPAPLLPAVRPVPEGRLLADLNLRRVTDVAALSLSRLLLAFGDRGYALFREARGRDDSPVRPPGRAPAVRVEESLARDSVDDATLGALLFLLVERAGRRLRAGRRRAGTARLTLLAADGRRVSSRIRLAAAVDDDARYRALEPLLLRLTSRRVRIRWMELALSDLAPESRQLGLFDDADAGRRQALARALDQVRRRHGEAALRRRRPAP